METLLGILASIAVRPIVGLLAYGWCRLCASMIPSFAQASVQVLTILLILGPLVVFVGASIRFFGAKAGLFVPDVPPTVVELVWAPLWSFAAIGVLILAAKRAGKNAG